jgi:hypothetical protein
MMGSLRKDPAAGDGGGTCRTARRRRGYRKASTFTPPIDACHKPLTHHDDTAEQHHGRRELREPAAQSSPGGNSAWRFIPYSGKG